RTINAVSGVATFQGCKINNPGTGYILTGAASGLTAATSNAFNITGNATKLVISGSVAQAAGTANNLTITAKDGNNNPALSYTGDKTLTFSGANASPNPAISPFVSN